jgi:hypothetical protein
MNFIPIPVAEAQTLPGIITSITGLLNTVIPLLFAIATVVFLWGVIMYITAGGEEDKRTEGRNYIIYGLIGLFVMVAVWGIVNVLLSFFALNLAAPSIPNIPGVGAGAGAGGGGFGGGGAGAGAGSVINVCPEQPSEAACAAAGCIWNASIAFCE